MTIDDLKQQRDGHLAFGPAPTPRRPGLLELCAMIGYRRDRSGRIVGLLRNDGGIGAIEYGIGWKLREKLIEAEYQGA